MGRVRDLGAQEDRSSAKGTCRRTSPSYFARAILASTAFGSIESRSPSSDCVHAATASGRLPAAHSTSPRWSCTHGVVGRLLGGAAQQRLGLVDLVLLEQRPAEAVEIRAVVRVDRQRALDQRDGFVEPVAALGQHVAEVIQRRRVQRIARQRLAERQFGARVVLALLEQRAALKRHADVGREPFGGLVEHLIGLRRHARRPGAPRPASGAPARHRRARPRRRASPRPRGPCGRPSRAHAPRVAPAAARSAGALARRAPGRRPSRTGAPAGRPE